MLFLKSLTFIIWNIALGTLLVYALKWFLFNKKQRKLFGWKIPLTPGFLVRKRDWLFTKARDMLHDYLNQASDRMYTNGYLKDWEQKVWQTAWDNFAFVSDWPLLPKAFKAKIRNTIATLAKDMVSKILRKVVPHFIEQLRIEHRIDELDEKLNIEFFYGYFKKYAYIPMLRVFFVINMVIGIMNMIFFLIIA